MAKTAGIILIGNEILSGKVADQNALYLCREFRQLGVDVRKVAVIPDEVDLIAREVAEFSRAYDWVFTSGGVGPTHDDVTIEGVARAFGRRVVRDPGLVAALEEVYQARINDARLKMAEVPEGAAAPGLGSPDRPGGGGGQRPRVPGRARDLPPQVRRDQGAVPRAPLSSCGSSSSGWARGPSPST